MKRLLFAFCLLPSLGFAAEPGERERADALNQQIMALYSQGRYDEALPLAGQLVRLLQADLGPDSLELASGLNNLAELLIKLHRERDAEPLLAHCLAIRQAKLPADHPDLVKSRDKLAALRASLPPPPPTMPPPPKQQPAPPPTPRRDLPPRPNPAQSEMERAMQLNEQSLRLSREEHFAEALPLAEQVLVIFEKNLPPDHPNIAIGLGNLAQLETRLGRNDTAMSHFARARALLEKNPKADQANLGMILANIADLEARQKHYDKAAPLLHQSIILLAARSGNEATLDALRNELAEIERAQGQDPEADSLLKGRVKPPRLALPGAPLAPPELPPPPSLEESGQASLLEQKLFALIDRKNLTEALPVALELQKLLERIYGGNSLAVAVNLDRLVELYRGLGRDSDAAPLIRRAEQIRAAARAGDRSVVAH